MKKQGDEKSEIVYIALDRIHPHPSNPRKDLGDLTELAESVAKNGIMQNLTLVPMEGKKGEYLCLIGHRRCAAAKQAGISEVPAVVKENISDNEQIGIMLEENMQRTDLTIMEQAQGFQMMLDLGDTVEDVVKKTGFSETTVRHRVKLNELNGEVLEEKQYQFTLADLYELEKIDDQEEKNRILEKSNSAIDLKTRVQSYLKDKKKRENTEAVCAYLEEHGVHEYTGEGWYRRDAQFSFNIVEGKSEEIEEMIPAEDLHEGLYYKKPDSWDYFIYVKDFSANEDEDEEEEAVTEEAIFAQKNRERKETLAGKIKEIYRWRDNYIEDLLAGDDKNPFEKRMSAEAQLSLISEILEKGIDACCDFETNDLFDITENLMREREWILDEEDPDTAEEKVKEHLKEIPACVKLLAMHWKNVSMYSNFYSQWNDRYNAETAGKIMAAVKLIEKTGLTVSDEEKEIIGGTHELYKEIVPEEDQE